MKRVKYSVAMSLDGFIAGPKGEIDWIIPDPSVDFREVYAQFDTVLLGRRTYELTQVPGAPAWPKDWSIYVFSRSMNAAEHPGVTVVRDNAKDQVERLRRQSGRDIWLFGGGMLFASLLAANVVDEIELGIIPVILGQGIPLAGGTVPRSGLTLTRSHASANGILHVTYGVRSAAG